MKKIVLVALMALCSVSFGFGGSDCADCVVGKQNPIECIGDCEDNLDKHDTSDLRSDLRMPTEVGAEDSINPVVRVK